MHGAPPTWQGPRPPPPRPSPYQQPPGPNPHPPPQGSQPGPGPPFYRYGPPAPFLAPRVPNAGEPYLRPPLPSGAHHHQPQISLHFRPQNVNHNPATVVPPPYPEMLWPQPPRAALPLPPPPPPPPPRPQGQMPLRPAFYPPQPPALPSVRTSMFSASKPIDMDSAACKVVDTDQARETAFVRDSPQNWEVTRHPEVGHRQEDASPINVSETRNHSPPPLKPMEPKIVEEIDNLCALTGDSDMEMEDDITEAEKDQDTNHSTEGLLVHKDTRVQSNLVDQILSESLNLDEKHESSSTSKPSVEVRSQVVDVVRSTDFPLDSSQLGRNVSLTPSKNNSGIIKGGSPMGLIQEYASGDESESDRELLLNESKPSRVLPSVIAIELKPRKDTAGSLDKDTGSKNRSSVQDSTRYSSKKSVKESGGKKVESESASRKVDEFGRLVREASTESDPNSGSANRRERRTKRGRSRSYSRSPRDRRRTRRRSPQRRRDIRSRSRSTSPRKRRSRSRSPPSRRGGEFGSGKSRSNRGHTSDCFDFLRGRCYRGASCRYVHHIIDKPDSSTSRSHRSNQRHEETRSDTKSQKTKQSTQHSSVKLPEHAHDHKDGKADGKRHDTVVDLGKTIVLDINTVLDKPGALKFHEPPLIDVLNSTDDTSQVAEDRNANVLSHQMAASKSEFVLNNLISTGPLLPNLSSNDSHPSYPAIAPTPHMPYSSMPLGSSYPLQFGHGWNPQIPNQHPQFSVPPNALWNLPPPPPRPPYELQFTHGMSSQIQPSHFPPRNELGSQISVSSHPIETLPGSQSSRTFLSVAEPPTHSGQLEITDSDNPISQRFSHTDQELSTSTSLGHANVHHQQYALSSQDLSSSRAMPYSSDSSLGVPGSTGFMSQHVPDHENQLSTASDFGLPRIVTKHNPYASTFDKPLVSKFVSRFDQDKGPQFEKQYDNRPRIVIDNQPGVDSYGLRPTESSPRIIGTGQYDPLLDSIEPTLNANKNECHIRDSDQIETRSDSHYKLLDIDETSGHEVTAVVSTTSLDNDEFGETADAEVGVVENGSPSDPAGVEKETESKSPGKRKKKDSTKPFKMAIADFVKDVLKPSWRQGNLSKEAFKTIVKKTVDKVSGAMKSHSVPKSRSKIDQYIDSSRRKLTKLVMGYVDKYVKAA